MRFSVPILIESTKPATGSGTLFVARPLFHATPIARNENLSRLTAKLARDLGKELEQLGRLPRQDLLARYSFNPRLVQQRHDIRIELRKRVVKARFLFLLFRQLRRRVAFTPGLPDLWFDLQRGEKLPERATAVLTQYFRAHESDDDEVRPEDFALSGTAWVQNLELDVQPAVLFKPPEVSRFLMLGGDSGEKMDGAEELRRVGRCLDWLYPDELDTVLLRDGEADELQRLLDADDRRPVLLVGPRMVGKTALLHEYVRRTVAQRATPFHNHGNTWLLAPARLISGMSYVGQWENRLLAIVKESRRREHLLYFDDLIGLFRAGQTS